MTDRRRALPAVDAVLRMHQVAALLAAHPRELVVRAVREVLAAARRAEAALPAGPEQWARRLDLRLAELTTPTLRRVVNATGVVLHTNLGRAPLAEAALRAVAAAGGGYSTLEYDLPRGTRGSRHVHCSELLAEITGAPDAIVVNNAASALLLALAVAAPGRGVVVSRGELIEIGGGFRIPEILAQSGAELVEVGTTNRTRLADYERAMARARTTTGKPGDVGAILKVHRSNFRLEGFTEEASLEDLVALGRKRGVAVLFDLGTGLMVDLTETGLPPEPTLPRAARSGATAVVASGDKLLGGPQAGILVGAKRFVAACRSHPLARAVRADKLTLAALAATLSLYRDPARARREIPVLRMLTTAVADLERRATELARRLPAPANAAVRPSRAAVGGGCFPGAELESRAVVIAPDNLSAADLASRLRAADTPVIGTVAAGRVVLDVRTLASGDEDAVVAAVRGALS